MFSKFNRKIQATADVIPELHQNINNGALWETRLQAAMGDDTELLALAIDAQSIEHKLSAVQALVSEESLKTAEREFRKHDRRVHTLAKQRYEFMVNQRETRTSANDLIQASSALVEAPTIPANRLAEINQAWSLLNPVLIEDEHKFRFAILQANLSELVRERGEHKRALNRWTNTAKQVVEELSSACSCVAEAGNDLEELSARLSTACEKARITLTSMPVTHSSPESEHGAIAELRAAIQSSLQDSALIENKLMILGELQSSQALQSANLIDGKSFQPDESNRSASIERWQELSAITNQRIENALNARFDECLRLHDEALKRLQKQRNHIISEKNKAAQQTREQALMAAADAMETALAAGNLAEAENQLAILQTVSDKAGISAAFLMRIGALQSEFTRLKGWQHWSGGRAREDLVLEAEALAASTVVPDGTSPVKFPIKQLENSIDQLRARWKELDRLGGATNKSFWQRFDGALKTTYLPVAAHLDQLSKARQVNLAARKKLLIDLDAISITIDGGKAPDWKEKGRALDHFKTEWRKLGPVEHTVPNKSQAALLDHMKASVVRLEVPLKEMQVNAQTEREQLIVRAKALSQDVQGRDLVAKLQELQSKWQSHAKSKPLPRKTENLLWVEFKAVADAIMSQRQAALNARDAEFKANQIVREALIARLEELHQDTPPSDIKRILASVDMEWRKAGEPPKNQAGRLESKYRLARENAHQHLAGSAQRSWQLSCDALLAKLALCEELESSIPSDDIKARWENMPALPPLWEKALQVRYKSSSENQDGVSPANDVELLDQLLLQLESSLEIPSPVAFQNARQSLKLLAMKNAMEGRKPATHDQPEIAKILVAALAYKELSSEQRNRFQSIIGALRSFRSRNLQA